MDDTVIERLAKIETSIEYLEQKVGGLENHITDINVAIEDLKLKVVKHDYIWKIIASLVSPAITGLIIYLVQKLPSLLL